MIPRTTNHKQALCVGTADLIGKAVAADTSAIVVQLTYDIGPILDSVNFFEHTPFNWITIMIHLGSKNSAQPEQGRISKRYGDLPLTIEVDVEDMLLLPQAKLCEVMYNCVVRCILSVAQTYELDTTQLRMRLSEYRASRF